MSAPRTFAVEGIVLRRREVGEADRQVLLYTRRRGKLWVLARGVRKPTSRLAPLLEPFRHSLLYLARGRVRLLVTQGVSLHPFPNLATDLERTARAFYVVELLDAFTAEEDPDPSLFELLLTVLGALDGEGDPPWLLPWYELQLLARSGHGPSLDACVRCGAPLRPEAGHGFQVPDGALCPACLPHTPGALPLPLPVLKVLRFLGRSPWDRVRSLQARPSTREGVHRLLEAQIRHHLQRRPRSQAFLQALERRPAGP